MIDHISVYYWAAKDEIVLVRYGRMIMVAWNFNPNVFYTIKPWAATSKLKTLHYLGEL